MDNNYENISYEVIENIAYIGFGKNKQKAMPVLDEKTLFELKKCIEKIKNFREDDAISGVIFFSHKDGVFLAGADINLIDSLKSEEECKAGSSKGQEIFNLIEDLPLPTIACIDGICLGGGLELALACKKILASNSPSTSLGLPEVQLGILPGFGGTYRLPLRIGIPNALDLILTGKKVNAFKAKSLGLVVEVFPKERLLDMALKFLTKKKANNSVLKSIENLAIDNFIARKLIFQKAREATLKETKGFYQAPMKILELLENTAGKKRQYALNAEAEAFAKLAMSEQSKRLREIFFLIDKSKKYLGPIEMRDPLPLSRGVVLGAGTMGGGIAWLMADHGMRPVMKDITIDALELGLKQSSANFWRSVKKKKMSYDDFEKKQRSISTQLGYDGFKKAHLIVEAVVENMDLKKKVFAEVEEFVTSDCIIASNTSSLSVTEMAAAFKDSSRFLGLHFFNPVHRMPLVEIITHDKVSPLVVKTVHQWCNKIKKTPIIVKDGPGFLVNRILAPYLNEASYLYEEGVSVADIDNAALAFGMPMGPFRLMDEVGIDVGVKVGKILHHALGERMRPSPFVFKVFESGALGKKSNLGFYRYDEDGKSCGMNNFVVENGPSKFKNMAEQDIQWRLLLPMINEAAIILDEGIVGTAGDVDLGLIMGIGLPPFRGGLLKYADSEGIASIVEKMDKYASEVSVDRYQTCKYLRDLVEKQQRFYDV
ncbi:MAG: hypothetical protein A2504_17680 [Bdellovibrionales bacterium RIFOXYD12_FULL_39_22]|nr:MAG: hypothetical protein A2385_15380 [Bdellovibrionales bacterium RIFOXYB1_FULL_39_21]OFZ40642.1 MAG: hypothetical protein A2485_03385 [Bdellovibrionales bacterium RIFOXYC12_FULL_39_17]OFZ50467.1 MAG: hypothetical protein A2404_02680 [Bdellovibrionales bacterium RIFOXYC1_FULL_39_130]OFZ77726.1 MAG: hypothetical protein A2560_05050 [Bdellovibrionales bacterium RIFOXYD1_FULL_39_84]OFZ91760.1 MAG: hypothetical protein A2504_17680 [Bdellovibrionales bacterium RIFOXYD12_FULL_39_22]